MFGQPKPAFGATGTSGTSLFGNTSTAGSTPFGGTTTNNSPFGGNNAGGGFSFGQSKPAFGGGGATAAFGPLAAMRAHSAPTSPTPLARLVLVRL